MNYHHPFHPPVPIQGPFQFGEASRNPAFSPVPSAPPYAIGFDPQNALIYESHPRVPQLQWDGVHPISPDPNGWYIPPPPNFVPNQPIRPPPHPGFPQLISIPALPPAPSIPEPQPNITIHEFWKGRLAPLPGFSSPPGLLRVKTTQRVTISKPAPAKPRPTGQLLPPRSFGIAPPINEPASDVNGIVAQIDEEEKQSPLAFNFDKYADIFIPQWLQSIQKQPQNFQPLPPTSSFPPPPYLQTFLLPQMIEDLCKPRPSTLLSDPPPTIALPLTIETYHDHWTALLAWELDKLAIDKEQIVLWKIGIRVSDWTNAEFVLVVPGIRENSPRLEIGDLLHMREVMEGMKTGSGVAFEGRVVALRKREGFIHLYCPALKLHIQTYVPPSRPQQSHDGQVVFTPEDVLPLLLNISFMVNARPLFVMEDAAATLGDALSVDSNNLARRWLFPEPDDLESELSICLTDHAISPEQWLDSGLNEEQRLAISSIALYQSPVPHLISGPPGTGKTRTVVEAVLQILRVHPEACILLCAPSNPATDTLVLRLRSVLNPQEMLRLNDQNRTFAEVPTKIMQYCYVVNNSFAVPPWKVLMRYRVVVCSCLDASILVTAQCTNNSLGRIEDDLVSSLHPHRKRTRRAAPHWTHLLIDEAAQGSEPELLIPISVVLTTQEDEAGTTSGSGIDTSSPISPQLLLCGDPNQLGPIVMADTARDAELDISLLERLFDRPLYADHAQARSRIYHNSSVMGRARASPLVPFTNLVKNYRSHPVILMPPSAIFYNDSLEPCATNGTISWSRLPNPRFPLVFIGNDSKEECIDERATWYNSGEIEQTVKTIVSLLSEGNFCLPPLRPGEIGVMAPWREQVWKLRERLRKEKLSAVDVGTVEDHQGRENRVIIISCVRSNPRFLKEDSTKGQGLVLERKRMNVAITRAKELLVVIGNGELLQRDPYWKSFLQFTIRNKLYVGPKLTLELDGNYISRLESDWIHAKENTIVLEEEEQGVVMAGGIAREVLREWI